MFCVTVFYPLVNTLWLMDFVIVQINQFPGYFRMIREFYLNNIFLNMNKEATKIVFWFKKLTSTQNNKSTFFIKLL